VKARPQKPQRGRRGFVTDCVTDAKNANQQAPTCEIRLRAERKAGQLLPKTVKKGQPKKDKVGRDDITF
jgi:hypothetical protein